MDFVSHGLWGGIAFGRKGKKEFWYSFLFGVLPDLVPFGPFFAAIFLGLYQRPSFGSGPPDPASVPAFVHSAYNATHSLIIYSAAFFIVWLILRRPFYPMLAWGLHILTDIPLHTRDFLPTPFLWPLSAYTFNGWNWGNPYIFFPNVALIILFYLWYFVKDLLFKKYAKNQ